MPMQPRPAQDDRSIKSFDFARLARRDDRSVRSWSAKTTATTTGGGGKNWSVQPKRMKFSPTREKHDPDGMYMRHFTRTVSGRLDPPAVIDVAEGTYLEDWASVTSSTAGRASSKYFSIGKIWKRIGFRRKGLSASTEGTSGSTGSFFEDAPFLASNPMNHQVASPKMYRNQSKSPRRSCLSTKTAPKPVVNDSQRVNFKPTTVARYLEDRTVSDSVHSVTTCQYDSLGTATNGTRKKLKKKKKTMDKKPTKVRRCSSDQCRVMGFPCTELKTGIQVIYSGPVNELFQPHGEGEFYVFNKRDGSRFHFRGTVWENGFMVSDQLCMFQKAVDIGSGESGSNLKGKHKIQYERTAVKTTSKERAIKKNHPTISDSNANGRNNGKDNSKNTASSSDPGFKNAADNPSICDGHDTLSATASTSTHPEYSLGQIARSRTDMLIQPTSTLALQATSTLRVYENAFLQRSNGLWTVAMLADRAMQPRDSYRVSSKWYTEEELLMFNEKEMEESMLFVISEAGATKIVPKRYWGRCVRKINDHSDSSKNKNTTHSRGGDDAARKEGSTKIGSGPKHDPCAVSANPQSDETGLSNQFRTK